MADELQIKIVLDDGSVKTGFINLEKNAKASSDKMQDSIGGAIDGISGKIKGMAAVLAAAFTVNKLVGFLKDSASAASEAESSTNALGASLANIGKFSQEAVSSFQSFASGLQKTTGVSDDLITQNAALLVSIGNLSGQGLERGTTAALNLAQALQIDVGTAFDLVSKAANGNTTQLGKYGIKLDENIPKSEKFAKVLELIETRFGGLAQTKLNTFEGALTNLSNAFGEIQESVGKFITNSPALRVAINFISEAFFGIAESIDKIRNESKDPFKPIILGAVELARVINEYLVKPLELGFNLIRNGVLGIYTVIQGLIALFVQAGNAVNLYLFKPIIEGFGFIGEKLVGLFSSEMAAKLKTNVDSFANTVGTSLEVVADSTTSVFKDSFDSLSASADDTFKSKLGGSLDAYLLKLKTTVESAKAINTDYKNATVVNTTQISQAWIDAQKKIEAALKQGIMRSIESGLSKIGENLAKGQGAFDNFGNVLLGIFGDLAIQIGGILIGMGIGIENLKVALATFNGAALVAAGATLIVLGGALKALSGGMGSAATAPSSSGGGIATTPSATTELTPSEQLTRQEPSTSVQVVIQGDVLDSDESGSRIVNLINEAFDKKGVVINRGVMA